MARALELYIDGAWYDAAAAGYVLADDEITITTGADRLSVQASPGSSSFALYDPGKAGRWSNRVPGAVNFRKLGRNTPVRISVDGDIRCVHEIPEWNPRWELGPAGGAKVHTRITAAGLLRRLTEGAAHLKSPMYRDIMSVHNDQYRLVYLPMEEGTSATRFANVVNPNASVSILDTSLWRLSAYESPGSGKLPQMLDGASITIPVPVYSSLEHKMVQLWTFPPAGTLADLTVIQRQWFDGSGTIRRVDVLYGTAFGGCLFIRCYSETGVQLGSLGALVFGSGVDGAHMLTTTEITVEGSDIRMRMVGQHIDAADPQDSTIYSVVVVGQTVGVRVAQAEIAPNGDCPDLVIGHVALFNDVSGGAALGDAIVGHAGERAGRRVERLLGEENLAFVGIGNLDDTMTMGPQTTDTLVGNLTACALAEQGALYETRTALSLTFRTRKSIYNQFGPVLDYAGEEIAPTLEPTEDITFVHNDVTASRPGGSSARSVLEVAVDPYHTLTTQAPPDGVGVYDRGPVEVNLFSDDQLKGFADWWRHLRTWDELRYPSVTVDFNAPAIDATLAAQLAALETADQLRLANLPAWLPPDPVNTLVRGMVETIGTHTRLITWNVDPGWPWEVWSMESGGSHLTLARSAGDTSLKIATESGPAYAIGAPLDVPYLLQAAGEAFRVTSMANDTITFVGLGTAAHGTNASVNPTIHASTQNGDALYLIAAIRNSGTGTPNTPAGWHKLHDMGNACLYAKYYDASTPAPTVSFTGGVANATTSAQIVTFRGASIEHDDGDYRRTWGSPSAVTNASAQDMAYNRLNVRRNGSLVLLWGWKQDDMTSAAPPAGFTELAELSSTLGDDHLLYWAYQIQTTATDIVAGSIVVTGGAAAISKTVLAAFRRTQTATVERAVNGAAVSMPVFEPVYGWRLGVMAL